MSNAPDLSDVVSMAINIARNCGYAVFPCQADNKKPFLESHSFKEAAKDAAAIRELWRRYPGGLIGVATGEVSGIDLLDVDIKHAAACAWWRRHHARVPVTRTYRTRGGGIHLHFRHAPGVRNDQGKKICKGVDVRGDGGYLIHWFAAGLECLDDTPPAPWPDWLLQVVRPPPRPPAPPPARQYDGPDRGVPAILEKVATAAEGTRNGILFWGACRLGERIRAGRIGGGEAETALLHAARSAGLPDFEARQTIASAFRRAP